MARYQNSSVRVQQRSEGPTSMFRYYVSRSDGKRVEHKTALGLVSLIGPEDSAGADHCKSQQSAALVPATCNAVVWEHRSNGWHEH